MADKVKIESLTLVSGTTNKLLAKWSKWKKSGTASYDVSWRYKAGSQWINAGTSNVTVKQATYDFPSNATQVGVKVKAIASKTTVNGKEQPLWTADVSTEKVYKVSNIDPVTPSAPNFTANATSTSVTASLQFDAQTGLINRATKVNFRVCDNTSAHKEVTSQIVKIPENTRLASVSFALPAGAQYVCQAQAIDAQKDNSGWSQISGVVYGRPVDIPSFSTAPNGLTQVKLTYGKHATHATGDNYVFQYVADDPKYFDTDPDRIMSKTVAYASASGTLLISVESGHIYYFRARVEGGHSNGVSNWTAVKSTAIAQAPDAPTTWSLTTTASIDEAVVLYWLHNPKDNTDPTVSQLSYRLNEGSWNTVTIQNTRPEGHKRDAFSYTFNAGTFSTTTKIEWRARTKGVSITGTDSDYGPWSVVREVMVYAKPTLTVQNNMSSGTGIYRVLETFPLELTCSLSQIQYQRPICYTLDIYKQRDSAETYVDAPFVAPKLLYEKSECIYSKVYDVAASLCEMELTPHDIRFENNAFYKYVVTAVMDTGTTVETSSMFETGFSEDVLVLDAIISIEESNLTAMIRPMVSERIETDDDYEEEPYENALLSVYRINFDRTMDLIAKDIDASTGEWVIDKHPTFGSVEYRIEGYDNRTGLIYYDDIIYPTFNQSMVVIQWGEATERFVINGDTGRLDDQPYDGYVLLLPYNISITEDNTQEVSLVSYAGRSHPVSYYGTQKEFKSNISTEILKSDTETVRLLRILSNYSGDCYIRDPSGCGYWATVQVSMSHSYSGEQTIPVSLSLTKVEGGGA